MADGRHFENGFYRYILAGHRPISFKFGVCTSSNYQNFAI